VLSISHAKAVHCFANLRAEDKRLALFRADAIARKLST